MNPLVSVIWLKENLNKSNLIVLDSSLDKTVSGSVSKFKDLTIPTARYFDLKSHFSDTKSPFPNTMPTKAQFEKECQKLGINKSSELIVFDNQGIYSSPRVWWMFKIMGHHSVKVLDGGLVEWVNKGFPTEKRTQKTYNQGDFMATLNKDYIIDFNTVKQNTLQHTFTLIDARSKERFEGIANEPRKTLKSGKIRGSINLPFKDVLYKGKYKSKAELKALFKNKCNYNDKLVFSCGSGLTACIVLLACEIGFKKSPFVYDGSWTEWATKNSLTVD